MIELWWKKDEQLWAATDGREAPVRVHRCFPWSDPDRYLSLRDLDDDEFACIDDVGTLTPESREALNRALAIAGFLLEVVSVDEVKEEVEIRTWVVQTKQGLRRFQTKLDDWPLQVPGGGLLIRDVGGDLYHVPEPDELDAQSRRWLWAYAG